MIKISIINKESNIKSSILNKNYSEIKYFKYYSVNIILMIIIFTISIFPVYSSLFFKSKLIKLDNNSQITLTIKGSRTQKILCINVAQCGNYLGELPDYVYVNGVFKYEKVYSVSDLIYEENNITLEWNTSLTNCEHMFCNLKNITNIDVSKFDTSKVDNMYGMFAFTSLSSLNLNSFNTSSVTNMYDMFYECSSLTYLFLNNFDTSKVTNFNRMFYNCHSLKILDLSSFQANSSSVKNNMFYNCDSSLIVCINQINASSILSELPSGCQNNCSEVHLRSNKKKIFDKDFYVNSCDDYFEYKYDYNNTCYKSCPENTYYKNNVCIDIPDGYYLNDTKLMTINKCNEKCKICSNESIYLNLCIKCNNYSNYFPIIKYNNNNTINNSFIDCGKDIKDEYYLDLEDNTYKPCYSSCKKCTGYGNETNHNCNECKRNYITLNDSNNNNCYEKCSFLYYFDSSNKYQCTTYERCPENFNKLIPEKNKCVSNCAQDNYYKIEFNNTCYKYCPNGKINKNNLCEIVSQNAIIEETYNESNLLDFINNTYIINNISEYKNEIEINKDIDKNEECYTSDFFDNKCKINTNVIKSIDEIISNIKNQILNGDLLLSIINGNGTNLIKKDGNIIYSISTLDCQEDYKFNITTVDIGECEDILKVKYKLNQNDSLFIFKIEYFIDGYLFPIIEYEIYSNKIKEVLNMDFCHDIKINMNIHININEDDLFKHDPSNSYYNDICCSYTTKDNTDIIIEDRQKEFNNNNMSLCESSCI